MKTIAVKFDCTEEQKKKILEAAEDNEVIFEGDSSKANIVFGEPEMAEVIANENLEWIQMSWAGTDKYTANEGFPKKVRLTNASGAFGVIISEYVVGAILTKYRNFDKYFEQQKTGTWMDAGKEDSLYGKTVLFLGTGDIGENTAKRLKAFGTTNIGLNRHSVGSGVCSGVGFNERICGFDKLDLISNIDKYISEVDLVISAIPNKPETRMLLNKERLLNMKKEAALVNVGRGSLLSIDELNEVMDAGHLRYVILDVTNPEPLPKEHPLWKQERCFITPHISGKSLGHCPDTKNRIIDICCDNLKHYLKGEQLEHEITDRDFEYIRK